MLRDEVVGAQEYPLVYRVVPAVRMVTVGVAAAFAAVMVYKVVGMTGSQPRVSFDWFLAGVCVMIGVVIGYLLV